jgi:hypothetical protein
MDNSTRTALRRLSRRSLIGAATAVLTLSTGLAAPALATGTSHGENHRHHSSDHHAQELTLPAGLRPEGITSGPGSRYYVGSLADGRIVTGDLRTGSSSTLLPGAAGRQLRGLYWDHRTKLVWAVGNVGAEAHVWAVDSRSGAVRQDTVVPGASFLNDLVVTRRAVWVTDSRVDRLTVIALGRHGAPTGATPTFLPLGGAWPAGDGVAVNANGIRQLSDGSAVLNNSRVGGLWQVDPRTGDVTQIPVTGGPGITSGDGLELAGRTLYDVRGSGAAEVSVLTLARKHGQWSARWVKALTDPRLDVPSTATLVGRTLWAVNARFGVASPDTAAYWATPLAVRH